MPIYEFVCDDCGNPFEALVFGFSTVNMKCPDCESDKIKKKISTFAVNSSASAGSSFNASAAACSTGST